MTAWNAWDICNLILESNFTTNWRVGLALFGIVQCFGTIGTNLFANSIPFGCDWAGVFPKWINIIRGQVICMLFSWAVCPWAILTSGARVSVPTSPSVVVQWQRIADGRSSSLSLVPTLSLWPLSWGYYSVSPLASQRSRLKTNPNSRLLCDSKG